MSRAPQVVIVGSIMRDMTFMCDQFPAGGQTVMARLSVGQGGKGSNQAIACGRAGARTQFIGATGRDAFSAQVQEFYRKEQIGCLLVKKSNAETGTAVILLDREGQNQIVIEPGANAKLLPADIPRARVLGAEIVMAQLEARLQTVAAVLRLAHGAGIRTVLNPAPMRSDFQPAILKYVDVLIPNESEFVALVRCLPALKRPGFDAAELAALSWPALHELCRKFAVPTLIVTLGSKGCFISEPSGYLFIPAFSGMAVVDTTGAGDAFCGGFAAGLIKFGGDIVKSARFGTAVAALSITKAGTARAMPRQGAIRAFLARQGMLSAEAAAR